MSYTDHIQQLMSEFNRQFQDFEMFYLQMEPFNNYPKWTVVYQSADLNHSFV